MIKMNLNEMSLEQLYQLQIDAQQSINEVKREDKVLLWCLQLHTGYQHIFYDYDWGGGFLGGVLVDAKQAAKKEAWRVKAIKEDIE